MIADSTAGTRTKVGYAHHGPDPAIAACRRDEAERDPGGQPDPTAITPTRIELAPYQRGDVVA